MSRVVTVSATGSSLQRILTAAGRASLARRVARSLVAALILSAIAVSCRAQTLQSVTVYTSPAGMIPGTQMQFFAIGVVFLSGGGFQLEDLTTQATWSSSNPSLVTIASTGLGVAGATPGGPVTISATYSGLTGTATVTVLPASTGTWALTGSMQTARAAHTATTLNNGMVLVAGGETLASGTHFTNTAELYSPSTGTFTPTTGTMVTARAAHTATLLNDGTVLITGGLDANSSPIGSAEIFNPNTGTFAATNGSMSVARVYHTATLLNDGTVLITGGLPAIASNTAPSAVAEIYNPTTGVFTVTGSMATARFEAAATLLPNGKVLVVGGAAGTSTQTVNALTAELYDPTAKTFSNTGALTYGRFGTTATVLNTGKVLVAGGLGTNGPSGPPGPVTPGAEELYDPVAGTFSTTGQMNDARSVFDAILLHDGTVLMVGGIYPLSESGVPPSAVTEIYNPATGIFTFTGNMVDERGLTAAALLPNGEVLVAGGYDYPGGTNTPTFLATAELYSASTQSLPTLVSIAVTPANPSIAKGATQQFTATGAYSDSSTQNITTSVTWASDTTSVATITSGGSGGLATGVAAGTAHITASLSGVTSPQDTLTVTAATLTSIAVTPANPSIAKGATQQFTATGTYSDSSTQNITTSVTWASDTPSVATIISGASGGLATGVAAGTAHITASLSTVTSPQDTLTVTAPALVSISVTPANPMINVGATEAFTATGTYSDNTTQNVTASAAWTSGTASVATVGAATGIATAVAGGTSRIQAAVGSINGSTTLTVDNLAPGGLMLVPAHSAAGTGFTLTVNGSNFVSTSAVTFNGKSEATTFVSGTQLTATIAAADVSAGGTASVTVTNPSPGGGASPSATFTIDDFAIAGPGATVDVTPGQPATTTLTISPTADGFANPVQLTVSGLPIGATARLSANPVTPSSNAVQVTVTLNATPAMAQMIQWPKVFPPLAPGVATAITGIFLLFATFLLSGMRRRRSPRIAMALWLLGSGSMAAALAGCSGGYPLGPRATPVGNYTLTVTAASGSDTHSAMIPFDVE